MFNLKVWVVSFQTHTPPQNTAYTVIFSLNKLSLEFLKFEKTLHPDWKGVYKDTNKSIYIPCVSWKWFPQLPMYSSIDRYIVFITWRNRFHETISIIYQCGWCLTLVCVKFSVFYTVRFIKPYRNPVYRCIGLR